MTARTKLPLHVCRSLAALVLCAIPAGAFERVQAPSAKTGNDRKLPRPVASDRPRVIPAAFKLAALSGDQVRITYAGHSTFLIESPKLVRIATDYNDYVKPPVLPDVVTMNHAHSTHYTDRPDPTIPHVLRGWAEEYGKPVRHDAQISDVRVRNVPTNIRDFGGGTERHGNSIFIFEMANLCIAHLGHLHHTLYAAAAQRDRPRRCGDGSGRRHLHARRRRHVRCGAIAQSAVDDSHAFLQRVHAGTIPQPCAGKIRRRIFRHARRWSCPRPRCPASRNS